MVFVLQADEPESEMESRVAKIESVVAENGGEVTEKNHWGVRQLAYEIRHETRGDYMHLLFKSEGPAIATLDNEFRLDHKVLRHLLVLDEEWQARNAANRARRPDLAPIEPPRLGAKPSAKPIAKAPEAKAPETKAPVSEDRKSVV